MVQFIQFFAFCCFAMLVEVISFSSPELSPATGCKNEFFSWKQQQIRYQQAGPKSGPAVLLVHGLFVNSDHWRKTIQGLANSGCHVFAIDLLGYGYSSKPEIGSTEAEALNGEKGRPDVVKNVELGSADGRSTILKDVDQKHPTGSPYNFFTWSELISDFTRAVIQKNGVCLVANSIGCISSMQAALDNPSMFKGVCLVTPNFRELHKAEVPLPEVVMPVIQTIQTLLREKGQGLFDALATPNTVKQILKEPYKVTDAIDDALVSVLLDPLLLEGASDVVFDTLSYSAGPLPEQQLSQFPEDMPVWICYGKDDPWTPPARVEALISKPCVKKVSGWSGIGHCPHDEAPELVNPFILDFMHEIGANKESRGLNLMSILDGMF